MNTQFFTNNGNQKFPLSTEALNFMQEQIKLAYGLTDLAGENIIVRQSSATETGLVIFDGELLPLTGNPSKLITIAESTEQMYVEGQFAGNVRTTRKAIYTNIKKATIAGSSSKTKLASDFTVLKNISTLMSELDAAKQHHVPTGAIMMWSGAIANIPAGWALCDGTNGRPDLRGRFIVGYDKNDADYNVIGNTGGYKKVALSANQSGLPDTLLSNITTTKGKAYYGTSASQHDCVTDITISKKNSHNANIAHENRPPYYALAYIIKII